MKTIYKYPVEVADQFFVEMPVGAYVLCVQTQNDSPVMWALVETNNKLEKRSFKVRGTGHDCAGVNGMYVGTFQLHKGTLVFHLWEDWS